MNRRARVKQMNGREKFYYWCRFALPTLVITALALSIFQLHYQLAINRSASLPGHLYLIVTDGRVPDKQHLIAFRPGATPIYPDLTYIKILGGIPGDSVSEKHRIFAVNDQPIGFAKPYSKHGKVLQAGPTGHLPDGYYFVYSPHPDSYDSRYADIGWVSQKDIVGAAYVVF